MSNLMKMPLKQHMAIVVKYNQACNQTFLEEGSKSGMVLQMKWDF